MIHHAIVVTPVIREISINHAFLQTLIFETLRQQNFKLRIGNKMSVTYIYIYSENTRLYECVRNSKFTLTVLLYVVFNIRV